MGMSTQKISCIWEPNTKFVVEEANADVDGKPVLAKVKGTFFIADGISRNNRFYPKELWERVCKDEALQQRIKERRFYGTIGHDLDIDDAALREGRISHIVTKLELGEDGKGVGEALILDTPTGRMLNTLFRAGSKMFVSTRANGQFSGDHMGIPKVDPNNYFLESIDFVIDSGFLQAAPQLIEHLEKDKENDMSTVLIENLAKENGSLKAELEKAVKEVDSLKASNAELSEERKRLTESLRKARLYEHELRAYKELGSPSEISSVFNRVEKQLPQYRQLGTPSEIKEALLKAKAAILEYKKLGTVSEIKEVFNKSVRIAEAYKHLGNPKDIAMVFNKVEKMMESKKREEIRREAKEISEQYGVDVKTAEELSLKLGRDGAKKMLETLSQSKKLSIFKKAPSSSINEKKEEAKEKFIEKPLGLRLMESFSK